MFFQFDGCHLELLNSDYAACYVHVIHKCFISFPVSEILGVDVGILALSCLRAKIRVLPVLRPPS